MGLKVLVGIPWSQHVTFLGQRDGAGRYPPHRPLPGYASCQQHKAIFAYLIGNEIPPDMVRWATAPKRVARLPQEARRGGQAGGARGPRQPTPISRRPSTSRSTSPTSFASNVYLHNEDAFRRYVSRLHNLAVDRPLVLTEFGVDSMREGEDGQARHFVLAGRHCLRHGASPGTFVFAWTDEWFTGGHLIEDWAFGPRRPASASRRPAFDAVSAAYKGPLPAAAQAPSQGLGRGLRLQMPSARWISAWHRSRC